MKFLIKKIIRKLYHLISFLTLFLIFSNNVNALTQCNSQGAESTLKEMPLLVFVGNGASSGKEYRFFTMDRAYTYNGDLISGSWNYQSFQKLCAQAVGSSSSSSNYITFRIANYTFLTGNIYTITFSMTDVSTFSYIQPDSLAVQLNRPNITKVISSSADPRDLIYYLTVSFYVTENYSGTSSWVFYSNANLESAFNSSDFVYTPYITTTPRYIDNSSSINSIKTDTQNIISGLNQQQQSINELQQTQEETNEKLNDIDDTLNNDSVDSSDDTLSDLQDNLPTNSVISDILLLPVRLLQAIINSLGGTCSSFNLGSLYGTNLVMPCIDIEHYVGSAIWTFIDLVFSGMFVLVIRKKFIQIWENITNLKGGGNEVD